MRLTGASGAGGGKAAGPADGRAAKGRPETLSLDAARFDGIRPGAAGPLPAAAGAEQAQDRPGLPVRAGVPLRWAVPAALAGGLALAAAFPPAGIWPLAIVGPALLTVAVWRRSLRASLLVGLVFGAAFFVPLLSWLVNVAWYAWAALAAAETVIFGLLTVGQRLLLRLRAWPVAVAGWWVAGEALRARWPYAFPWGRLAMSQAGAPTARWAAIGGAPLLTFLLALAGASLAWLLLGPARGPRTRAASRREGRPAASRREERPAALRGRALAAVAFGCAAGLVLAGRLLPVDQGAAGDPAALVAAVQGDVPHARNLPGLLRASTVTQNHAAATERLAAWVRARTRPAPGVVIWPENSTDLDPGRYPSIYAAIAAAVDAVDRPVLVGAVLQGPLRNAGQLWLPRRGPAAVYIKRQLVPFGEVIPFRGLLSHVTSLTALQPVNFTPGRRAVVFRLGKIRLGDVICYEVGFDSLVRSEVAAGANLLSVQSNDADFELDGQPGESEQQVAMARIRAIESDRAVVYASTTGESAIIAPDGAVIARSGLWQQAVLEARVPLRTAMTPADRLGGWTETALTAATLAAVAWALIPAGLARRRQRRVRRPPVG
ncbi:MAG TPA: apolipoprotein N-acyltransferase [Streptosporangiaceae bacterium]|nr:apolipoprotein N-acyltransferase [Streptosporangiaceae bacterium]